MTLGEWMEANGLSDEALAEKLSVDRSTASRFRRGKLMPSNDTMRRIIDVTGGVVQPNSFFGLNPAPSAAESSEAAE